MATKQHKPEALKPNLQQALAYIQEPRNLKGTRKNPQSRRGLLSPQTKAHAQDFSFGPFSPDIFPWAGREGDALKSLGIMGSLGFMVLGRGLRV